MTESLCRIVVKDWGYIVQMICNLRMPNPQYVFKESVRLTDTQPISGGYYVL